MNQIKTYTQTLLPAVRRINELNEYVKYFKKTDEEAVALVQAVKNAQEALKEYLAQSAAGEWLDEIATLSGDLKDGVKDATKDTEITPVTYKAFLTARAKEKDEEVVVKGEQFNVLRGILNA